MSPSEIQVYRLEILDDDNTKQAVSTLVEAFKGVCSGGDDDCFERLIDSIFLAAYRGGQIYVASYKEHTFAGVAAWFPPGQGLFHTPDQAVGGFDDLVADFSPELRDWWINYFLPKYSNQTTSALGEGVKLASWHLQLIGVSPEHQRKGIGSALIDLISTKAKADGVSLCLEVEEGPKISFYEKCGFVVRPPAEEYINPVKPLVIYVMEKQAS
ncbi:uncharacterized protein STEHIDRAFT_159806 [Stereum hirsutum FP-91666 SS1]|uniref:uncharacterized protein n=1 Tax=Stereum hirsutum (strain FP-91666) TaxID=721885 RepID=UPI0004449BA8|nr:uncharacterized protein STEHIDRAFT_159806 [Stereum hirsutum FP-91666 SS1]EIM83208.1 hypothetical protein STEHIDRAFT_159806 [Stereum hirsutum FP-91666 SS1]